MAPTTMTKHTEETQAQASCPPVADSAAGSPSSDSPQPENVSLHPPVADAWDVEFKRRLAQRHRRARIAELLEEVDAINDDRAHAERHAVSLYFTGYEQPPARVAEKVRASVRGLTVSAYAECLEDIAAELRTLGVVIDGAGSEAGEGAAR